VIISPAQGLGSLGEQRDVTILRSLPGVGRIVLAMLLGLLPRPRFPIAFGELGAQPVELTVRIADLPVHQPDTLGDATARTSMERNYGWRCFDMDGGVLKLWCEKRRRIYVEVTRANSDPKIASRYSSRPRFRYDGEHCE
jgi:hypothetical protein